MAMSDELAKLGQLHQQGVLSDEEFSRAKARVLSGAAPGRPEAPAVAAVNALRRSRDKRWFGGVCGGIGQITGMATWVWRLVFALLVLCGGTGVLFYLLLWIFVPLEDPGLHGTPGELHAG
jgi:phage shock protein PspC (stress-responsive transcriptional regulator)